MFPIPARFCFPRPYWEYCCFMLFPSIEGVMVNLRRCRAQPATSGLNHFPREQRDVRILIAINNQDRSTSDMRQVKGNNPPDFSSPFQLSCEFCFKSWDFRVPAMCPHPAASLSSPGLWWNKGSCFRCMFPATCKSMSRRPMAGRFCMSVPEPVQNVYYWNVDSFP